MSLIVPIDHHPTFTPKHSLPAPERLIAAARNSIPGPWMKAATAR